MKHEQSVQVTSRIALAQVEFEYSKLIHSSTHYSILDLLNFGTFRLQDYCKAFNPHPRVNELKKKAKEFCDRYGIWLPNAEHYVTCIMYLFPMASVNRMIPLIKNCAVDFYLNDMMGREVFKHLSPSEQQIAKKLKQRIVGVTVDLTISDADSQVEIANIEMLQEISKNSPANWFHSFLELYNFHIQVAHQDGNTAAIKRIPSIEEYFLTRCHVSGMPHTVAFIEYSSGKFLDWKWLDELGLSDKIKRLNWIVCLIGCLLNDLFSFEKEVIDNKCDSNLVMIVILNDPNSSLQDGILQSANIIRTLLIEFFDLLKAVKEFFYYQDYSSSVEDLKEYFDGLERCVQASWVWQVYTKRYKRYQSLWKETQLTEDKMIAVS